MWNSGPVSFHMDPVPGDVVGGMVAGDTDIALMDGNHCTIAELVEDLHNDVHHLACALRPDGTVHTVRLNFARRVDGDAEVLTVTLDDGATVHCTPGQLLLAPAGEWLEARALREGDLLLTADQPHRRLGKHVDPDPQGHAQRRVIRVESAGTRSVYEFRVEVVHNVAHPSGIFLHD